MMVWMWVVRVSCIVVLSVLFEILLQTDATEELFDAHSHASQNAERDDSLVTRTLLLLPRLRGVVSPPPSTRICRQDEAVTE